MSPSPLSPSPPSNFDKVHHFYQQYESPKHFIDWNYLFAVSAALGRRIWFQKGEPLFPNIYVVFVGDPGLGKSMPAKSFCKFLSSLTKFKDGKPAGPLVNIAPQCVTLEKLFMRISQCVEGIKLREKIITNGVEEDKVYIHSSISFILADELGMLLKKSPTISNTVQFLHAGYDCSENFENDTKNKGTDKLINMCVNLLGCCTPEWMGENVGSGMINDGWTSRVFFIWGEEKSQRTTFYDFDEDRNKALEDVKKHLKALATISGEVTFSPEALAWIDNWYQKDFDRCIVNRDPRLKHYYSRRKTHLIKLSMDVHFADNLGMVVEVESVKKADSFLTFIELNMHKALAGVDTNPIAKLAGEIKAEIAAHPIGYDRTDMLLKFFSVADQGAIDAAIGFLSVTNQIGFKDGEKKYYVKEKIIKYDFSREPLKQTEETQQPSTAIIGK